MARGLVITDRASGFCICGASTRGRAPYQTRWQTNKTKKNIPSANRNPQTAGVHLKGSMLCKWRWKEAALDHRRHRRENCSVRRADQYQRHQFSRCFAFCVIPSHSNNVRYLLQKDGQLRSELFLQLWVPGKQRIVHQNLATKRQGSLFRSVYWDIWAVLFIVPKEKIHSGVCTH